MTELDKAKQEVQLVERAIASVMFSAIDDRKVTHSKHPDKHYDKALYHLEMKLTSARAYLTRILTIGR